MIKRKKRIVVVVLSLFLFVFMYQYSPRRVDFLGHYDKVFAHRVNSLQKQQQALNYFDGIELDLVYLKHQDVLDVNHPPSHSIGLTFESYLSQIKSNKFPFLWLDIKKLDTSNAAAILLKLNTLFESKNYPKNKVLIETRSPDALPKFTDAGYKTSYYLNSNLHRKEEEDLKNEIKNIEKVLELQPLIGISFSYTDYSVMKLYFPSKTKYVWALTSPYRFNYNKVRSILKDEKVEIVLTKFKSLSGNR